MFFGGPSIDLKITIFLLVVSLIVSLIVFTFAKRKLLAFVIFSILENAVFLANIFTRSEIFDFYGIRWLGHLSFFIWPLLNIYLIYYYVKTKK